MSVQISEMMSTQDPLLSEWIDLGNGQSLLKHSSLPFIRRFIRLDAYTSTLRLVLTSAFEGLQETRARTTF